MSGRIVSSRMSVSGAMYEVNGVGPSGTNPTLSGNSWGGMLIDHTSWGIRLYVVYPGGTNVSTASRGATAFLGGGYFRGQTLSTVRLYRDRRVPPGP